MDFSRQRSEDGDSGNGLVDPLVYRILKLKFECRQVPNVHLHAPGKRTRESSRWRHVHYSIAMECCDAAFHDSKDRVMYSDSCAYLIFPAISSVLFIVT